jgi:hypothetical protein
MLLAVDVRRILLLSTTVESPRSEEKRRNKRICEFGGEIDNDEEDDAGDKDVSLKFSERLFDDAASTGARGGNINTGRPFESEERLSRRVSTRFSSLDDEVEDDDDDDDEDKDGVDDLRRVVFATGIEERSIFSTTGVSDFSQACFVVYKSRSLSSRNGPPTKLPRLDS